MISSGRRLACALPLLLACLSPAILAQVEVRKGFAKANPSLSLVRFEGSDDAKVRLEQVLTRADWFHVVPTGQKAKYALSGRYTGRGGTQRLELQLAQGEETVFSHSFTHSDRDRLLFHAVDGLIEALFRVPGPCSGKIAYAVAGEGQRKEVYLCNFDGTGKERLTHNANISTEPSWGPDRSDQVANPWIKIEFGQECEVDQVRLTLRADFPHDVVWTTGRLEFSDGSHEDIKLKKSGDEQRFKFAKRTAGWVRLSHLKTGAPGGWAALSEFEVWGRTRNDSSQ